MLTKFKAIMLKFAWFVSVITLVVAAPTEEDVSSRVHRTTYMEAIATSYGYSIERHNVTTPDGYILGVFRMPFARFQTYADEERPVVFVMHGLFGQSSNFLALDPQYSIGYNLVDAGFDVWFGNARGNVHSRAHTTLDPDDPTDRMLFFDFSWEEIGMIDIPAMIDYVLQYTGKDKLHYIGHSQGGTVFLVMGSMLPEYNEKMASVHLLAGVGYMEYFPDSRLRNIARLSDFIYSIALSQGLVEIGLEMAGLVNPTAETITAADLCFGTVQYKHMCDLIGARYFMDICDNQTSSSTDVRIVAGWNVSKKISEAGEVLDSSTSPASLNFTHTNVYVCVEFVKVQHLACFIHFRWNVPSGYYSDIFVLKSHVFFINLPTRDANSTDLGGIESQFGGGSLKQIAHYGQNIRDQLFRRFNYNSATNQELYGSTTPPLYDLSLITSNVVMHYTVSDNLLDERDVLAMANDMPNTSVRKVARETFEHNDFSSAVDARELVNDWIIEEIINVHSGMNPSEGAEEVIPEAEPVAPLEPVTDSAAGTYINGIFYLALYIIYLIN